MDNPAAAPPCERLYLHDGACLVAEAVVLSRGEDARGAFLVLSRTPFHPQGGGQPADRGTLALRPPGHGHGAVLHVAVSGIDDAAVRHYVEPALWAAAAPGSAVQATVDGDFRALCARLHSAGHLVAACAEALWPQVTARRGHHFPGEAHVACEGPLPAGEDAAAAAAALQAAVAAVVAGGGASQVHVDADGRRQVTLGLRGGTVPCGGTHVARLGDVGTVEVTGIKHKKGTLKLSYRCADGAAPGAQLS